MTLITNPNFTFSITSKTGADLVGEKLYMKHDFAGGYLADEIVEIHSYTINGNKFNVGKLGDPSSTFEVNADVLENGTATRAGLIGILDDWQVVDFNTLDTNNNLLSQIELQDNGKVALNATESVASFDLRIPATFEEDSNYVVTATLGSSDELNFMLDNDVISGAVDGRDFQDITDGFTFSTDEDEPTRIRLRLDASETLEFFQINKQENIMATTQDGTHKFGIEVSPVSIGGSTYIMEAFSINKTASRVDIDDGNGAPVGSTIVEGRIEGSSTLQLEGADTAPDVGSDFTLSGTDYDGTYVIQDVSETQAQADYAKVSVNFYKKINP
jgi:hypothetical protein